MRGHGNYRRLHYTEAIAEAEANNEILVTTDDVLIVNQGSEAAVAIHIVAEPNFWEHDEPKAYEVQLVRPMWLYGSEGHLYPIRWVGRMHEFTDEELESATGDEQFWNLLPDDIYLWALPKVPKWTEKPWQRCELNWWQAFREPVNS
jgi:hypothetical protein